MKASKREKFIFKPSVVKMFVYQNGTILRYFLARRFEVKYNK